jgi:cation transport regulator ChaC
MEKVWIWKPETEDDGLIGRTYYTRRRRMAVPSSTTATATATLPGLVLVLVLEEAATSQHYLKRIERYRPAAAAAA